MANINVRWTNPLVSVALFFDGEQGLVPPGNCVRCEAPVPSENAQPFAILQPCCHGVCSLCLAGLLATKLPTEELSCMTCNAIVESHVPYSVAPRTVRFVQGETTERPFFFKDEEVMHSPCVPRDVYTNPDQDKDPVRYWMAHSDDNARVGKGILYHVVSERNSDGQIVLIDPVTCHFDTEGQYCSTSLDEQHLEDIFSRLNRLLVKPSASVERNDFRNLNSLVASVCDDNDLLTRLLYALGGGVPLNPQIRSMILKRDRETSNYIRSDWFAAWSAKQLLIQFESNQTGSSRSVGALQQMVGDMVYSLGAEKKTMSLLSEFRLSGSLSYLKNKSSSAVSNLVFSIVHVDPLAFRSTCYDNFELRNDRTKKCHHWVFNTVQETTVERLKEIGFYENDEAQRISRVGKTLDDLKQDCKDRGLDWIEVVFGEREDDIADYSFYTLRYIQCAIELELLSIVDCTTAEDEESYSNCKTTIPRNLGIDVHPRNFDPKKRCHRFEPRSYDPNNNATDYYRYKAEDFDPADEGRQTMLSMNNMRLDKPLKQNLGTKAVVNDYNDLFMQMNSDQLDGYAAPEAQERPVAEIMHAHVCDGQPQVQILSKLDELALQNDTKWSKLRSFPGGFHMVKEMIHKKHSLTEEFVRLSIKGHRTTPSPQEQFLRPADPNDFEEEEPQRLLAIIRDAVDKCLAAKGNGSSTVSPKEVNQHMLDCAKAHPQGMEGLIDVRNSVVYFMLRDAEKCNSCELFFTAIRLALPLFITTNCSNYIRICFELLLWRELAPTSEIVLFRETAFTRETPGKKHIYVDKSQEKIIGVTRCECGEKVLPGCDEKVDQTVLNMQDVLERKQSVNSMKGLQVHQSSGPFNESSVPVNQVHVHARLAVHRRGTWVLDRSTDNILRNSEGELMPTEFLRYRSIGYRRNWEYGDVFYGKSRYSVSRPTTYGTGGVPISTLRSLPKQLAINKATQQVLMTSLSAEDLKKACKSKKDPLASEIMDIHGTLTTPPENKTFSMASLKRNHSVPELIELLLDCRKRQMRGLLVPGGQEQQDMSRVFEFLGRQRIVDVDAYSDPELRQTELDLDFYKLSTTIEDDFSYNIKVSTCQIAQIVY